MATDNEQLGYDETLKVIRSLPTTWIPALLIELAEEGYRKGCFRPFGASRLVNNLENKDNMRIFMQEKANAPANGRDQRVRQDDRGRKEGQEVDPTDG